MVISFSVLRVFWICVGRVIDVSDELCRDGRFRSINTLECTCFSVRVTLSTDKQKYGLKHTAHGRRVPLTSKYSVANAGFYYTGTK